MILRLSNSEIKTICAQNGISLEHLKNNGPLLFPKEGLRIGFHKDGYWMVQVENAPLNKKQMVGIEA